MASNWDNFLRLWDDDIEDDYESDDQYYKYDDGSGSFYGYDGSSGFKNADGSGSFTDSDRTYGYINSDGSGYYDGEYFDSIDKIADNTDDYEYQEGDLEESLTDLAYSVASLINVGVNVANHHIERKEAQRRQEEEEERIAAQRRAILEAEEARKKAIKKQKRKDRQSKRLAFYKRHPKLVICFILLLVSSGVCGYKYWEYINSIEIGFSTQSCQGKNYEQIGDELIKKGFTRVYGQPVYDISIDEYTKDDTVLAIQVRNKDITDTHEKIPFFYKVIIQYHCLENIKTPLSSRSVTDFEYTEVKKIFEDSGFINIKVIADEDLIFGWIN
ncbi:MAG: hypothetical protein K6F69_06060, partial [Treponema sp.]|nr:hypothetical protein [Treponema sp.]